MTSHLEVPVVVEINSPVWLLVAVLRQRVSVRLQTERSERLCVSARLHQ